MTRPETLATLRSARAALAGAEARQRREMQELARLARERSAAERNADRAAIERAEQARGVLQRSLADLDREVAASRTAVAAAAAGWAREAEDPLADIADDAAVVMLPVRLETRFLPDAAGADELLVRVYPDDIHVDAHEPELTPDERSAGSDYWAEFDPADTNVQRNAWVRLAGQFGAPRAAWIARVTDPQGPGNPGERADDWTRGASTAVLPDRWLIAGILGGDVAFRVLGNPVPDVVRVGPDPSAIDDGAAAGGGLAGIDPALRWIEDFTEAERIGLGIRVPAVELPAGGRIDLLLALGVKSTLTAEQTRDRLAATLRAHRYTEDMGFVARGTPTNNTEDRRAGDSSDDALFERSFAVQQASAEPLAPESNGERLGRFLGLDDVEAAVLSGLPGAQGQDHAASRAMISTLWPATWWYYLKEMMHDEVSDAQIEFARGFFTDWVYPGGTLATLRLGRQPYAVWPVTDTRRWQPREGDEQAGDLTRLSSLLAGLRPRWTDALSNIPRAGDAADPAQSVMRILGMDGASRRHYARAADGEFFFFNLMGFGGAATGRADFDGLALNPEVAELASTFAGPQAFDIWNPFLRRASFDPNTFPLSGPRVRSASAEPEDYLSWLLQANPDLLADEPPYHGKKMPLLYLLLRHAARLEFGRTARKFGIDAGLVVPSDSLEPVMVNFAGAPSRTYATLLQERLPEVTGTATLAQHLGRFRGSFQRKDAQFNAFWSGLERLRGMDAAELDLLLRETLDLAAHRLDAVLSGLANKRLDEVGPAPRVIGGFGWVENLQKSGAPRSLGRILAPSVDHARSAAVLRAGHLAHRKAANPDAMAVNLSSARVRLARKVLQDVGTGIPLGAVLGYRFERMLHEHAAARALDRYIRPFRQAFPLTGRSEETEALGEVVDGYALNQRRLAGTLDLSFVQAAHLADVRGVLDELNHLIDALGDALLANGMFHTVTGNPERARSTLDAIARGDADPPELDFARTPHRAVAFSHRVVLPLHDARATWPAHDGQVRRRAEPRLDAWLGSLLPDPAAVGVLATAPVGSVAVPLTALRISPLDLLQIAAPGHQPASELHERFLTAARDLLPGEPEIALDFGSPLPGIVGGIGFDRLARHLDRLRGALESARFVHPHEIAANDQGPADTWDIQELKARADAVATRLGTLAATSADPALTAADALDRLWDLRAFGLTQALPETRTLNALREQLARAKAEADEVLARHAAAVQGFDRAGSSALATVEHDIARLRILLGPDFPVVPQFTAPNAAELAAAAASDILGPDADTALPLHDWVAKQTRVQPALGRLIAALTNANRILGRDGTALSVLQFPVEENGRWCGLPLDGAAPETSANKVSVVFAGPPPADDRIAALMIDGWTESLPLDSIDGAVAFHFDQPAARAANAVLLAVPPRLGEPWSADTMIGVLRDALEIGKIRAVDGTALEGLGQYLPAIMLAANEGGETVSTDISRAVLPILIWPQLLDVFTEVSA